jgi:hypothetical protein
MVPSLAGRRGALEMKGDDSRNENVAGCPTCPRRSSDPRLVAAVKKLHQSLSTPGNVDGDMKSTYSGCVLGLVTLAAGFVACGGGGETSTSSTSGGGGATSTTGTSTSAATGAGGDPATSTSTGAGSGTSTASSTGTGMTASGYCTKPCGTVLECCPAGSMGCPSNMYPNNYKCDKNACRAPQCATTADCAMQDPTQDCLALSGFNTCGNTCSSDGQCTAPATCSGVDDNGKKYCLSSGGGGCADDVACGGFGKCVNKVCVCQKDADCTKPGFTKCAL